MVAKLVLQTERLVSSSGYVGFTLQFASIVIIPEPGRLRYQSSLSECRFCCSGSSGFVVGFRLLRLLSRGLVPVARRNPGRCRYRYICHLKSRNHMRTIAHTLRRNWRFHAGYGLLSKFIEY